MLTHRRFVSVAAIVLALAAAMALPSAQAETLGRSAKPATSTDPTTFDTPGLTSVVTMPSGIVIEIDAGPSGAPAGFSIDWMLRSTFDALGGWPTSGSALTTFFGVPTLYTLDTSDYTLDPTGSARIFLGYFFDETGLGSTTDSQLSPSTDYVIRVRANGDGTMNASANSPTVVVSTTASNNCTFSWGYWKNHPSAWLISSVHLGSVTYTASQMLAIFNKAAAGNGLISLAHELIAAKLSIAQGADPTPILSTIAAADALIGSLVVPPVGAGSLTPSSTSALTSTLNQYNNGLLGVQHCGTVPNLPTTWGAVKVRYR